MTHPNADRFTIISWRLLLTFLIGPVLWALQIGIGYGLAPLACNMQTKWPVYMTVFVSAVVVLIASYLSYQSLKATVAEPDLIEVDQLNGISEFITISSLLINLLFLGLILMTAITAFFLSPCPLITMPLP